MAMYTIGEMIKSERIKQGITQEKLCEEICSPRWLSKIEAGTNMPASHIVEQLLERLELSIGQYIYLTEDIDLAIFELRLQIEKCWVANDVESVKTLLIQFEWAMNNDNLMHQQIYLTYYALVYVDAIGEEEQLKQLEIALKMTQPTFDIFKMDKILFSMIEIVLLNRIAILYGKKERLIEAEIILENIVILIESSKFDAKSKRKLYPQYCENLAKVRILLKKFNEALIDINKGIDFMINNNLLTEFPRLLFNKGMILCYLSETEQAQTYFTQSCYMHKALGNEELSERQKRDVEEIFGIFIE